MIRCGIIGFGKMGHTRGKAIAASGKAKVVRTFDPVAKNSDGYSAAADSESILSDANIDAVFICTPNFKNKPLTISALNAGKHVFCEKPPAFTAADVVEIQKAEKASGKKLMYGFNHRHHSSIRAMKTLVDSGQYGQVLWMRGRYGKSVDHTYFETWRSKKEMAGGGILLDQGIHMVDLFLLLADDFDEVQAMVSSLYWNIPGIEDNVFANFRNSKTGVAASLHSTMTQWRHLFSLEVFLEKGYLVLNGLKTQSGSYGHEILSVARNRSVAPAAKWDDEDKTTFSIDSSWNDETNYFLDAILLNRPIETGNSADALKVMRLIDAVYKTEHYNNGGLHDHLQ
jgi:1,5-anhydro-D-fructose reductase (1,5-anhydro-D-mannitol-forming)